MEAGPSDAQATLAHYWDDDSQPVPFTSVPAETPVLQTLLYGAVATVVVFWLGQWINVWRRTRRERAFNLELRRRHGIPDSDTRPFNVAYQAASIAARDTVRKAQLQAENHKNDRNSVSSTANIKQGFRPLGRSRPPIPHFPAPPLTRVPSGSFSFRQNGPSHQLPDPSRALSQLPNPVATGSWGPQYSADNFRATSVPTIPTVSARSAFAAAAAGSLRATNSSGSIGSRSTRPPVSSSRPAVNPPQIRSRKRLYLTADEEAEQQQTDLPTDKRSRTAGWGSDAMIDGDNEPTWAQAYPNEPKPTSDSYAPQIGKSKGKRPADDAEGDLRADGKRRHTKSSKQRPKPDVVQGKRGTKRERKEVDTASVLNDVMPVHKRGRAGDVHKYDLSIVKEEEVDEEDDPTVSRDPLCGGRKIGQKWTSNGQEYMVGPNGDRLRLVTVKESRKKYYMPADSKHADNFHTVEVFVEKWLTEEQYSIAKADGLLAWQENENLPAIIKQESPEKTLEGKENQTQEDQSRTISTAITFSRARAANTIWNTPGQSPLQTSAPQTNPFNTPSVSAPQSPGPRRVRYSIGTVPAAALNASRMMSTWEKQEREANALKMLKERRAAEAAAKAPPAPAPTPSITISSATPTPAPTLAVPAPAITVTAPSPAVSAPKDSLPATSTDKPAETKLPTFSFALPAPSAPKPAESTPAAAANPFSFAAPKKDEATKPLFPPAPAPAPAAAPSTLLFPPVAAPNTSSNLTPTPALFGAPASTPAPAAPSPFGAPASAPAAKPSPFAFSAPSAPSQPTAPAANPAGTPLFGAPAAASAKPFGPASIAPAASPFGATPAAPAPPATKPMGGFSFAPTPAAPAPTSTTAPAGSTLFGGLAAPKPASTGFSFNTANGTSAAKPSSAGFSFAAPQPAADALKPNPFGVAPASTVTSSGFGTGFGTGNATGTGAGSPFTFNAPKAADPKPAAPASTSSGPFKFNTTNNATSGFQFAKPTVSIPTGNVFGAPPTATPTTANGAFTFGANANNAVAVSPATPSKPLFNLGAAASPVMGTRQISTSKRVQRAMSKPPQ